MKRFFWLLILLATIPARAQWSQITQGPPVSCRPNTLSLDAANNTVYSAGAVINNRTPPCQPVGQYIPSATVLPATCTINPTQWVSIITGGVALPYYCKSLPGTWQAVGAGGGGTPGGADTQVQINNAGAFGATPNFTYNLSTDTLTAQNGSMLFGSDTRTQPFRIGTIAAITGSSCTVGDKAFANDAAAGDNDFSCTAPNVWTQSHGSGTNATSIQSNPVDAGILSTPGTDYRIKPSGSGFEARMEYDTDSRSCGLPTDNTTDAYTTLKNCINNHPGAHIRLWKTAAASGVCDYKISNPIYLFGSGQWLDGMAAGPQSNQPIVRVCTTQPGQTAFIGNNQMAQAFKISNFAIFGQETWTKATGSTFIPAFDAGYPGFQWITATTTAGGSTITLNGTNEAWTNQTDGKTVQILGGGAVTPESPVSIATTANNYTATCTCTRAMIGETVAIPGAGPGGGILYAHIIGLVGATPVTGNAYLDQKPISSVGAVSSVLTFDYYGVLGNHTTAASSPTSPTITTAVTNAPIFVGSTADGIRGMANFAQIEDVNVNGFGRNGIDISNSNAPYLATGGASNLSDNVRIQNPLIQSNRGHGIYCAGGDCNVNKFILGTISSNQGYAIKDVGFLINTIDSVNAASNHNDCTTLPCPSTGGASGGFKNTTAVWLDGVPYATATAPPIFHTDGTCTDSSTTVTLGSAGFTQGHADIGSIVKLTACGTASADLTTFVTGFTSSTSVTVQDAPTCGGACPAGTGQVQIYQTVNLGGTPNFDVSYLGHSVLLAYAGADGQALVTTAVIQYSATKFGVNAAATNRSRGQMNSIYFGSADYQQELNWAKAWDFTTGSITGGTTALTTSAANELFPVAVCNTSVLFRVQFTIKGAGPGGTDHNATCSSTLAAPGNAVTLSTATATTVGPNAEVQVTADGGSYVYRAGICVNCYEEVDQFLHGHKFGSVNSTPSVANPPAVQGTSGFGFSPFASTLGLSAPLALGCFIDGGCSLNYYAGRNKAQQFDVNFCDVPINNSTTCVKLWRQTTTAAGAWSLLINELTALSFARGALRDYIADTAITSGITHRFKCNNPSQNCFAINADASITFGYSSASTNATTFTPVGNTLARTIKTPDAAGTMCITGNGNVPCQTKRTSTGSITTGARADVTMTWTTAFADTNYTAVCSVLDSTTAATSQGLVFERLASQAAGNVHVTVFNPTGGSITGTVHCHAFHD